MSHLQQLRQLIIPCCTIVILSSCLVLAWRLYQIAYLPLFSDQATVLTADDYTIPRLKLQTLLEDIERKQTTTVDVSQLRNPFAAETTEL